MRIKNFNRFEMITEGAARMPVDIEYWKRKGKSGKNVAMYTHDDLDGIFSAIEMKNWLIENSSCKYHLFAASFWGIEAFYIKDRLKMIQKFEKELAIFKESQIELKRK